MPNCFKLVHKGQSLNTPGKVFSELDDEMCAHFGVEPHPNHYFRGWYDSIGLALAMGADWDRCREIFAESPKLLEVVEYLAERYDVKAWYCPR